MYHLIKTSEGFPGGSDGKESACNAEDLGLIPESGISPGEGQGYLVNIKQTRDWPLCLQTSKLLLNINNN